MHWCNLRDRQLLCFQLHLAKTSNTNWRHVNCNAEELRLLKTSKQKRSEKDSNCHWTR